MPANAEPMTKPRREIALTSEAVLHRELNRPLSNLSRHLAERSAGRVVDRDIPVRVVQHVERLGPELNLLRAGDANTLADAEIEIPCRRIAQHVPRLNAERAGGRPGKRRR